MSTTLTVTLRLEAAVAGAGRMRRCAHTHAAIHPARIIVPSPRGGSPSTLHRCGKPVGGADSEA